MGDSHRAASRKNKLTNLKMAGKRAKVKQQGVKYTEKERKTMIEAIRPYLQCGYNLKKACVTACLNYETIQKWVKKDTALSIKVSGWQGLVSAKARMNIAQSINRGDESNSKWWLERRERDDFSTKIENKVDGEGFSVQVYLPKRD